MDLLGRLFGAGHDFQFPIFNRLEQQPPFSISSCELEITGGTSWSEYMQNVNNSHYGLRCTQEINPSSGKPCQCQNPLVPTGRYGEDQWTHAFETNLHRIAQWEQANANATIMQLQSNSSSDIIKNLDVVFLGDSITEHWAGERFGELKDQWNGNAHVFQSLFGDSATLTPGPESDLLGMPLGISGDQCANLLYRLHNGILATNRLNPSLWWILIGTNDRGGYSCLENHVVAGTIAIVEYLRQERPNAKIVINSILPRGPGTVDGLKYWQDFYQPINRALECYAQGQGADHVDGKKVIFFNATDLFLTNNRQIINLTLLPDELHPEEEGSWVWGRAMAQKIQEILAFE